MFAVGDPCWNALAASLLSITNEEGERLGPATTKTLWIPDEMANAHGGKLLAIVPVGEASDLTSGFVLPDLMANFVFGGS